MTPLPSVSIVIPTWNRCDDLVAVLEALDGQWLASRTEVEILVVDDGSSDGTGERLQKWSGRLPLRLLSQPNSGPARARNRGCEEARHEVILFLGDDTVPQPGLLMEHLEHHRVFADHEPLAVLGYTTFPRAYDSPFLRFLNEYGSQFGYALIDRPLAVGFNFFYTSNISLPRRVLQEEGGFREDFPAAAWEDIEFAYRAVAHGLRMHYQPRARTIHHHRVDARTFCLRQRTSGRSAAIFVEKHPELADFLGVNRPRPSATAGRLQTVLLGATIAAAEAIWAPLPHRLYRRFVDLCYLEGLASGLHGR